MSLQTFLSKWQTLSSSIETAAALGAELRLRSEGLKGDSRTRELLRQVVEEISPEMFDDFDPEQQRTALAIIQMTLRQALDLLENPGRPPGWQYEDPAILESQGQSSTMIVRAIARVAAQRNELAAALQNPAGVFLDVGTGVGRLAIGAAQSWPSMRIVGIDSSEIPLRLARQNVEQNGLGSRIELRLQSVEQLDEEAAFTLAWLPGSFISAESVPIALRRIHQSLAPGGWIIFGIYAQPSSSLGKALVDLRTVRSGGYPWTAPLAEEQLRSVGFESVETLLPTPVVSLIIGGRR